MSKYIQVILQPLYLFKEIFNTTIKRTIGFLPHKVCLPLWQFMRISPQHWYSGETSYKHRYECIVLLSGFTGFHHKIFVLHTIQNVGMSAQVLHLFLVNTNKISIKGPYMMFHQNTSPALMGFDLKISLYQQFHTKLFF